VFTTAKISEEFFFTIVISIKHCINTYTVRVSNVYKRVVENAYCIRRMRNVTLAKKYLSTGQNKS
jgi:hypothetical protein